MKTPNFILWIVGFFRWLLASKQVKAQMIKRADTIIKKQVETERAIEIKQRTGIAPARFWYFRVGYWANRYKNDRKRIFVKQWNESGVVSKSLLRRLKISGQI